tara:strand:+ start:777 stop:1073 length:297 start_codon:yes stop_codon:yes gene_type:complete
MAIRRNARTAVLNFGKQYGTGRAGIAIYTACKLGTITVTQRQIKDGERLDTIAGQVYGDASLWWVIAAASGIGWNLQVPPGVVLSIPVDLNQVNMYVG